MKQWNEFMAGFGERVIFQGTYRNPTIIGCPIQLHSA